MEGLIELAVLIVGQIISALFNPVLWVCDKVRGVINYFDPNSLPEQLTYDDLDVPDDESS